MVIIKRGTEKEKKSGEGLFTCMSAAFGGIWDVGMGHGHSNEKI
jgi:hypothetical protein